MTHELPDDSLAAPFVRLSESDALKIASAHWGIAADSILRFDTERDDTFQITADGRDHVLKVAHPLDDRSVIDLQCGAMNHASIADESLPLPRLVPTRAGSLLIPVQGATGEVRLARVLTYLPGSRLQYAATSCSQRRTVGAVLARLSLALTDFEHPAASRYLPFDLKQLGGLRPLATYISDAESRRDVECVLDDFDEHVGAALAQTRQQVVHHDLNPDNVLTDSARLEFVTGVLDFGDVVHSSVVGDLAVAMAYAVPASHHLESVTQPSTPWSTPYDIATGFAEVRPLRDDEQALLPKLVKARLAQRLILNSWLAGTDPSNAHYTGRTITTAAQALRQLLECPRPPMGC